MPVALVTGASGQDGSYLLDRLLNEGYTVCAVVRSADAVALEERGDQIARVEADLLDTDALRPARRLPLRHVQPDYAARSSRTRSTTSPA